MLLVSVLRTNRLGANSSLDLVIFGRTCSINILKDLKPGDKTVDLKPTDGEASIANVDKLLNANGDIPTAQLRLSMQKAMQKHAAVFRRGDVLKVCLSD